MGLKLLAFLVAVAAVAASAAANFGEPNNVNMSNYYYGWGRPRSGSNCSHSSREIIVGGDNRWQFGFDYNSWAFKNNPFYVNDTLVFKYAAPSENNTHPHSVYLFNDFWSFRRCNLKRATMLANTSDGAGDGFKFVLARTWKPYYFACGASNGFHCTNGNMKFFIMPRIRWWNK
ncbi:uncharacterized protein LOC116205591 [Punica granatum]|uniref:Phytocyanin domain-containing protein n=2 Tax=Punica granatum TaxID=22663 RepID=A0A218XG72_PUNGR|nr:uncharacterized protein LOC116205591 [Punica granatum]OWM83750.1 hypothetical protein CDL15_Pgr004180 [Punica granatum]PKI47477.1 hypothetical protein CRG98_032067 [Punica granatum]